MKSIVPSLIALLLLPLAMIFSIWSIATMTKAELSESFVESRMTNIACYAQTDSLISFEVCVAEGKVYRDGEWVLVDKTRIRQVYQVYLDKQNK